MKKKIWLRMIMTAALAGGLSLAAIAPARADRDYSGSCRDRLESDRARIDHDAARYGPDSYRVDRDRDRMDRDRRWCRDHHSDWDHSRLDIGIYFHPHQ